MGSSLCIRKVLCKVTSLYPKEKLVEFAVDEYIHVSKMEKYKMLMSFVIFQCSGLGAVLLYALLFSWEASCI